MEKSWKLNIAIILHLLIHFAIFYLSDFLIFYVIISILTRKNIMNFLELDSQKLGSFTKIIIFFLTNWYHILIFSLVSYFVFIYIIYSYCNYFTIEIEIPWDYSHKHRNFCLIILLFKWLIIFTNRFRRDTF